MTNSNKTSIFTSKISHLFICFISLLFFLNVNPVKAQLTFNNGLTAQQLAQMLAGPGVSITNATINCASNAIGSFTGTSSIGIANGILLTTGNTSVASPNTSSGSAGFCNSTPGDPQLLSLAGATTYDACALEFDIIPLCDTVSFNYSFGSDEYPEFVNSGYNDAFAFYINGPGITGQQNIAKLPGTSTFVTIDNVNAGSNSQYYVANSGTTIEYDGYTTVLTAWIIVQACQTYHMKIVIADAGDCVFDSGVFLQAGTLNCQSVSADATIQNAIEGCQDGNFMFTRPAPATGALTINYTIAGTATNGTDYTTIGTSITIPAGQLSVNLPIVPIADGTVESPETILLIYQPGPCPIMDTAIISIIEITPLNAGPDENLCSGISSTIGVPPVGGITYSWTPATGLSDPAVSNPSITLLNTGTTPVTTNYILNASVNGCFAEDTVAVTVNPIPVADAGIDQTICGGTVTLAGTASGYTTVTWSGGTGVFNPNNTTINSTYSPSPSEITAGSVTLTLTTDDPAGPCVSASDDMTITINSQVSVSAGPDQSICAGNTVSLAGAISGSTANGAWGGGTGTYNPDSTSLTAVYIPSATDETAGSVTLTYTVDDPGGPCSGVTDQLIVTIGQLPTANAGSGQFVCSGSGITLAGSIGGSATSATWSGGSGTYVPDNTSLNAVYTPSTAEFTAGSVALTLTTNDPAGECTLSSSNVTFNFYENPSVDFTADSTMGCPVMCANFEDLTIIAGGGSVVSWDWDFGDGSSGADIPDPSHCFLQSGFFDVNLVVTSNNGCISTLIKTQFVEVFNFPEAEFTASPSPASMLDPTINFSDQSSTDVNYWDWDFGDSTNLASIIANPVHTYSNDAPTTYLTTLIVRNNDGCLDTVAHVIIIGPAFTFYIPNAFTPGNKDGKNDYFFGSGIGIEKYDFRIFDRWGDMIFHGKSLNDKWDGKANSGSDTAQIDVYVWKVEITDVLNKKHNYVGTVTVTR